MSFIEYPCFDGLPLECCSSENRERNHLSRSSGNQSFGIGDPLAPRTRIEPPCCQSGVFHRQQVVTGRDSGPAIADVPSGAHPSKTRSNFFRKSSASRKCPSCPTLESDGSDRAPGMCPATGSSVSFSPRKRSAPRPSMSRISGLRIPEARFRHGPPSPPKDYRRHNG